MSAETDQADRREAIVRAPRVLITGTHSTGKTELVSSLLASNADLAHTPDPARSSPFLFNRNQGSAATEWLIASQIRMEVEAETLPHARFVLCDRGMPDIVAYYRVAGHRPTERLPIAEMATRWTRSYQHVLVARPDPERTMAPDQLRLDDEPFRHAVQQQIESFIVDTGIAWTALPHGMADRIAVVDGLALQGVAE